jgi:hypothetical protein
MHISYGKYEKIQLNIEKEDENRFYEVFEEVNKRVKNWPRWMKELLSENRDRDQTTRKIHL